MTRFETIAAQMVTVGIYIECMDLPGVTFKGVRTIREMYPKVVECLRQEICKQPCFGGTNETVS